MEIQEAAWPSDQRNGLTVPRSRVRGRLWELAGLICSWSSRVQILGQSAMLVNDQLVASCQLGFLILFC